MTLLKNVYVPLLLLRVINTYSMQLTQRNNHENISELLDNLLRGYDNSVRPDFGGINTSTLTMLSTLQNF